MTPESARAAFRADLENDGRHSAVHAALLQAVKVDGLLELVAAAGEEARREPAGERRHEDGERHLVGEAPVCPVDEAAEHERDGDADRRARGDEQRVLVVPQKVGEEEGANLSHLAPNVPADVEFECARLERVVGVEHLDAPDPRCDEGALLGVLLRLDVRRRVVQAEPLGHLEAEQQDGKGRDHLRDTLNDLGSDHRKVLVGGAKRDARDEDHDKRDHKRDGRRGPHNLVGPLLPLAVEA
mmetsp:Transcript_12512/g.39395  ORF Transcript_12512/g.39395 Transcript_12512/m.39395 type:complete len:241 (-) Transcript_12512:162-884(-)